MRENSQVTIVYNYIRKEKGITGEEIAKRTKLPRKLVSCYISKLLRENLIKHEGSLIYNNRKRKRFVTKRRYKFKENSNQTNKLDSKLDSAADALILIFSAMLNAVKELKYKTLK